MNDQSVTIIQPQSVDEVKAHVQRIQKIMKAVMKKDTHYGVIPGTQKPTLYKAGAEILLSTFRIAVDPEIEDLSTDDQIRYRIKLRGIANAETRMGSVTGNIVGAGVGEASTNEEKYKWKGAGDKEWENTAEDRRRIKYGWKWGQQQGEKVETEIRQVRTEPADLANTVLKMAKKRAQIDLCLTALSASDIFTQDADDFPEDGDTATTTHKPSTSAPQASSGDGKATEKQVGLIKMKVDQAGIREVDFLANFDIAAVDQLPFEKVNDALAWIQENGA